MNPDSRLINGDTDIRATLPMLTQIAAEVDEVIGELPPGVERTQLLTAVSNLGAMIAAGVTAADAIREAQGDCRSYCGFSPCNQIKGHGGLHRSRGGGEWDDDAAERVNQATAARMGDRTE